MKTIFDCVSIRGITLEDYKMNFANERSGLYDVLVRLFKGGDISEKKTHSNGHIITNFVSDSVDIF